MSRAFRHDECGEDCAGHDAMMAANDLPEQPRALVIRRPYKRPGSRGCPKCGSRMYRVKGRDGGAPYMRCEGFPKCPGSRSLVLKAPAPQGEKPVLASAPVTDPKACVECGKTAMRMCPQCKRRVCESCREGHDDA